MPTNYNEFNGVKIGLTVPGEYTTTDGEKKEHRDFSVSLVANGNFLKLSGLQAASIYQAFKSPEIRAFINAMVERERENLPDGID